MIRLQLFRMEIQLALCRIQSDETINGSGKITFSTVLLWYLPTCPYCAPQPFRTTIAVCLTPGVELNEEAGCPFLGANEKPGGSVSVSIGFTMIRPRSSSCQCARSVAGRLHRSVMVPRVTIGSDGILRNATLAITISSCSDAKASCATDPKHQER